uniref:Uncharacterized protein n=1 Tax=Arcella intermedia TaxID=1963864 RepID=A0A6B2L3J0_9EUKA
MGKKVETKQPEEKTEIEVEEKVEVQVEEKQSLIHPVENKEKEVKQEEENIQTTQEQNQPEDLEAVNQYQEKVQEEVEKVEEKNEEIKKDEKSDNLYVSQLEQTELKAPPPKPSLALFAPKKLVLKEKDQLTIFAALCNIQTTDFSIEYYTEKQKSSKPTSGNIEFTYESEGKDQVKLKMSIPPLKQFFLRFSTKKDIEITGNNPIEVNVQSSLFDTEAISSAFDTLTKTIGGTQKTDKKTEETTQKTEKKTEDKKTEKTEDLPEAEEKLEERKKRKPQRKANKKKKRRREEVMRKRGMREGGRERNRLRKRRGIQRSLQSLQSLSRKIFNLVMRTMSSSKKEVSKPCNILILSLNSIILSNPLNLVKQENQK